MNRLSRPLAVVAVAALAGLTGCGNVLEPRFAIAATEVVPVAMLDLPEGYVAPSGDVPVATWDLSADYVAPVVAGYDASLDVPAPVTVVEG